MTTLKSHSLQGLSLTQKSTILLCLVFIIGMIISSTVITFIVNDKAKQEMSSKAMIVMETMNSVRDYTDKRIQPQLRNQTSQTFVPEVVPAFSARIVFENLRKILYIKILFTGRLP